MLPEQVHLPAPILLLTIFVKITRVSSISEKRKRIVSLSAGIRHGRGAEKEIHPMNVLALAGFHALVLIRQDFSRCGRIVDPASGLRKTLPLDANRMLFAQIVQNHVVFARNHLLEYWNCAG